MRPDARGLKTAIAGIFVVLGFAILADGANAQSADRLRRDACNGSAYATEQWVLGIAKTVRGSRVPSDIEKCLGPHFNSRIGLHTVRYAIGARAYHEAQKFFSGSSGGAVTLGDLIIFSSKSAANDRKLWAHELHHVQQYRSWGRRAFLAKYCKDQGQVERDAREVANAIDRAHNCVSGRESRQRRRQSSPPRRRSRMAYSCVTRFGRCRLRRALPYGSRCMCVARNGRRDPGVAR